MYPYIDMHCDSLLRTLQQGARALFDGEGMQSIRLMEEAGQLCQFFAVFFPPRDMAGREGAPPLPPDEQFFALLRNNLYEQVEAHADRIGMAYNYEDILENQREGKASAILTVEDGRLAGSLEKLQELYTQGVRAIGLTWNFPNCFGFPHSRDPEMMGKGLTEFGRAAVQEMNRLGILVDVSHLSDGGFFDVAACSSKPFIASHSNCRALTPHTRNLTDEMIVLLAQKGGVAGLNFGPEFVSPDSAGRESRIEDLTAHVLHFLHIGGEDCIGIGTDFDGMGGQLEISHPAQMQLLFDALAKKGLSARQLDKLASGNVLRVIREAMK